MYVQIPLLKCNQKSVLIVMLIGTLAHRFLKSTSMLYLLYQLYLYQFVVSKKIYNCCLKLRIIPLFYFSTYSLLSHTDWF